MTQIFSMSLLVYGSTGFLKKIYCFQQTQQPPDENWWVEYRRTEPPTEREYD
jgi:hypothetical protein